jgi:hypothetical protein
MLLLAVAACDPADAAPPALTVKNLGSGAFAVENPTSSAVKLKTVTRLERKTDKGWEAIPNGALDVGDGYRLVESCGAAPACTELGAGKTLRPVRWTGMNCSAQCNKNCDKNSYHPDGTYRLTVETCDGKTVVSGPPFEHAHGSFK